MPLVCGVRSRTQHLQLFQAAQSLERRPRSAARQVLLTQLSRAHVRTSSSSACSARRDMAPHASAGSSGRRRLVRAQVPDAMSRELLVLA